MASHYLQIQILVMTARRNGVKNSGFYIKIRAVLICELKVFLHLMEAVRVQL